MKNRYIKIFTTLLLIGTTSSLHPAMMRNAFTKLASARTAAARTARIVPHRHLASTQPSLSQRINQQSSRSKQTSLEKLKPILDPIIAGVIIGAGLTAAYEVFEEPLKESYQSIKDSCQLGTLLTASLELEDAYPIIKDLPEKFQQHYALEYLKKTDLELLKDETIRYIPTFIRLLPLHLQETWTIKYLTYFKDKPQTWNSILHLIDLLPQSLQETWALEYLAIFDAYVPGDSNDWYSPFNGNVFEIGKSEKEELLHLISQPKKDTYIACVLNLKRDIDDLPTYYLDHASESFRTTWIRTLAAHDMHTLQKCLSRAGGKVRLFVLENYFDVIHVETQLLCLENASPETQHLWKEKIYFPLFSSLKDCNQGPLSSSYCATHFPVLTHDFQKGMFDTTIWHFTPLSPNMNALAWDIVDYTKQEYRKGNIVFFHGQNDSWAFFEHFFKYLYHIKYQKSPTDFVWLRFSEKAPFSKEEFEKFIKGDDSIPVFERDSHFDQNLRRVICTTLHPFSGPLGANPWGYATSNDDCTSSRNKEINDSYIRDIFKELGFEEELKQLNSECFKELYKLYNDAIVEQGNHGRILTLSIPKSIVGTLAYPADYRGRPITLTINGEETSDVTIISENFGQTPVYTEFCIGLVETICNPDKAQAAGVKIVGFDPTIYQRTEKYLKFEAKLAEAMKYVETLYKARLAREAAQHNK